MTELMGSPRGGGGGVDVTQACRVSGCGCVTCSGLWTPPYWFYKRVLLIKSELQWP